MSTSMMTMTNKQKVKEIFNPDETTGESEWIERKTLEEKGLMQGNNGHGRNGVYFNVPRYVWEVRRGKHRRIIALRTKGLSDNELNGKNRPIRPDIELHHKAMGCVVCGSNSSLVTDHKNDLYNDLRVLSSKTQTKEDFQCLCEHCNLQKRQISKKTKETKKRVGATTIPQLAPFGIDFIEGDESYDEQNVNAMVGTYWHDPIAFMEFLKVHPQVATTEEKGAQTDDAAWHDIERDTIVEQQADEIERLKQIIRLQQERLLHP